MIRRPPRSTRTDTLFPYTTLFRSHHALGLGGDHDGEARAIAFQPLRHIDRGDERAWAAEWIAALLTHEHVAVTPEIKESIWSALNSLATAQVEEIGRASWRERVCQYC